MLINVAPDITCFHLNNTNSIILIDNCVDSIEPWYDIVLPWTSSPKNNNMSIVIISKIPVGKINDETYNSG
jgi:hypothetical protein